MSENTLEFDGPSSYLRLNPETDYSATTGLHTFKSPLPSNKFCLMKSGADKTCGTLTVGDTLSFEGDVEESAKQFFDFLCTYYRSFVEDAKKIKLVDFDQQAFGRKVLPRETDFRDSLECAKQLVEDAQMVLYPGEVFDMQPLMENAMNCLKHGHLVNAAAMLLAIADHTGLIKEGTL